MKICKHAICDDDWNLSNPPRIHSMNGLIFNVHVFSQIFHVSPLFELRIDFQHVFLPRPNHTGARPKGGPLKKHVENKLKLNIMKILENYKY